MTKCAVRARKEASAELKAGVSLGPYEIVAQIGAGGMGEVYKARDTRLGRDVAIKVLPAGFADDAERLKRFEREAKATAALSHPNILAVHDVGTHEGVPYLVEELLEGESLKDRLARGALPVPEAVEIAVQVAHGLAAAHEKHIVHRDLKPGNVFITKDGTVKILDFGLAKLVESVPPGDAETLTQAPTTATEFGRVLGTLAYMAPEQARGRPVDPRADIFSFGVVLYEMLAGERPFRGETVTDTVAAILKEDPPPLPPTVPRPLAAAVERCLAKEPDHRYQRASEVHAVLKTVLAGSGTSPQHSAASSPPRRRWPALTVAVVAVLLIGAALSLDRLRTGLVGGTPRIQALAVLPLENLSGDPEQDYFADGMTEELITTLAKISALKVISRTSVMQYKNSKKPLPQIAKELNVEAVIEGSVRREGGRVRITAQLIQASTDQHLWAESYERDLRSVLSLQSEIARAIAAKVHAAMTPAERARLASARPVDPEAHEEYLKGRYYLNKMTPEGFEKGLAYLQRAAQRGPENPLPYAALALGYSLVGHERHPDAFAQARTAVRKAEELGGEPLAEMYLAFGMIKLCSDWDYDGAKRDFQRAMELNPSIGEAHRWYSWYLFLIGQREQALAEMKRAQEVEPLTPLFCADRGWQNWWAGQNDKALEEARKSLDLDPTFNEGLHVLGAVLAEKGMFAEAIMAHQKLAAVDPAWRWSLTRTYAQAGRKDEARKLLAKFLTEEPKPTGGWAGWFLAETYAALGDKDEAFRWLEAAYRERHSFMPWIKDNSAYAPLRSDPRFQSLLLRMSLPST